MPAKDNRTASLLSAFQQKIGEFLYDPITNWQHFFSPQFGIFNQFSGNPEDEEVESAVLQDVGSYGSQLSTLLEAFQVLRTQVIDERTLNSSQIRALHKCDCLWADSQKVVSLHRTGLNYRDMERLIDYMAERLGKVIPQTSCTQEVGIILAQDGKGGPEGPHQTNGRSEPIPRGEDIGSGNRGSVNKKVHRGKTPGNIAKPKTKLKHQH